MTNLQRAETYAAIFLKVGPRWPDFVPVDATVLGSVVHLGDVRMEPTVDGGWRLTENGKSWIVRKAVPA